MPGKIVNLDATIKATVQDVFDDLLRDGADGGLGKPCRLVYPSRSLPCTNCVLDPVGNKSSNHYRSGGPVPFPSSQPCPMCNGKGRKQVEQSEVIILRCEWEPKKFRFPFPGIELRTPYSVVETKGYMSDVPKFLKADHIVVNLPIAPYLLQKFRLEGEPGDPSSIIQGRYVSVHWVRWNG